MSERLKQADKEFHKPDPNTVQKKDEVDFTKGSPNEYKFYPDNPTSEYNKMRFASKEPSKFYDPCSLSSQMSMSCLEQNNYNKDMCYEYFKAYRECKKEWLRQRRADRNEGWTK